MRQKYTFASTFFEHNMYNLGRLAVFILKHSFEIESYSQGWKLWDG